MEVIIVGAGVVGITTAYYLEAEGHEVTVVERQDRAGMKTSFANAGQLCRYTARPWAGPSVPAMIFREMGLDSAFTGTVSPTRGGPLPFSPRKGN